jgi:hypothetical protein
MKRIAAIFIFIAIAGNVGARVEEGPALQPAQEHTQAR